jgi:peptidoglycan L-alanyl-D-glutamate endopeptidase CwlK
MDLRKEDKDKFFYPQCRLPVKLALLSVKILILEEISELLFYKEKKISVPAAKKAIALILIIFFFFNSFKKTGSPDLPPSVKKLMKAYPGKIISYKNDSITWFDKSKMQFDNGKKKRPYDSLLLFADIEDQFYLPYTSGPIAIPKKNEDPGRIRNEDFFKKMYGATKKEVIANCGTVQWLKKSLNQKILFSKINGANTQLQKVSDELELLPDSLKKFLSPLAGTFNWRTIEGTNRLSPHSFAIAIDLNTSYSDYWRWQKNKSGEPVFRNKIPLAIVKIFEKHGFIWGGRWYHYDTMHFEYRPEFFVN